MCGSRVLSEGVNFFMLMGGEGPNNAISTI